MVYLRARFFIRRHTHANNVFHNGGRITGMEQVTQLFSEESIQECWDAAQDYAFLDFGTDMLNGPFKMECRVLGTGEPTFRASNGRKFWTEAQARSYDLGYLQGAVTDVRDLHDFSQEGYIDGLREDAAKEAKS